MQVLTDAGVVVVVDVAVAVVAVVVTTGRHTLEESSVQIPKGTNFLQSFLAIPEHVAPL